MLTTTPLFPGQVEELVMTATTPFASYTDNVFFGRIRNDPDTATFRECREDNNESERVEPSCLL